jgi:hypothetical protein
MKFLIEIKNMIDVMSDVCTEINKGCGLNKLGQSQAPKRGIKLIMTQVRGGVLMAKSDAMGRGGGEQNISITRPA